MSQVNLLNLDELAPTRRNVTFGGKTYRVKDMTVEHFIELNKLAQELEARESGPVADVTATVRSIALSLEGCDIAEVQKLSIEQLAVLSKFIRNEQLPGGGQESAEGNAVAQSAQD